MKLNLYLLITLLFFFSITSKAQIYADTILNEHGVADAKSIISGSTSDYAVLQPGVNDSASVTLGFTQHGLPGMYCTVTLKQDDAQLSDSLLKRLSFIVYDTEGNVLVQKDSFYVGNVNYVEGTQNFLKFAGAG